MVQKYTGDILHIHINTLYSLHSHEASSFWADFSQTRAKVKIEENRRERSPNIHSAVLATDYVPKKNCCKKQNSFTRDPFVFSHPIYLTSKRGRSEQENGDTYRVLRIY